MKTTINVSLVAVVTAAICAGAPARASAQMNGSQRPYKALFGGSAADPEVHHSFDVSLSVIEGYEDNALGAASDAPQSLLYQTGFYTGVSGSLSYSWQGQSLQIAANVGSDGRYYAERSEFIGVNRFGGIGFTASFGPRTSLTVNQSISSSPAYLYGVFAATGPVAPGDVVGLGAPLGEERVSVYSTSGSVTRNVSRRGSIEALGSFQYSDFGESASISKDLQSYAVGGRYRQSITRYAALRLGYVYRTGTYSYSALASRATAVHDIDIGVDYRRPLSLTRRTTVDFGVGSSIVNTPTGGTTESSLQYRVLGDIGLNHQMGRTWSTRIAYNRGLGFTEGFGQPIFSDAMTGTLAGFFSRRVDFNAIAGFSIGTAGVATASNDRGFKAYTASARVRYALASMWALFGEYSYYKHSLGDVLLVAEGVPSNLDRNSVHVGVTLWLPLLRR